MEHWSEDASFALLDAWGERVQNNRISSDEWVEVAEKVTQESAFNITVDQCRNRLDTLKKKYKKEKSKFADIKGFSSKWVYFNKMDMYMSSWNQANGASNSSKAHTNLDASDGMKDSLENDESDHFDHHPTKRTRMCKVDGKGDSLKLLADSINRFTDVYEKVHASKSEQSLELETMRMDFQRDLVSEIRKVFERAHKRDKRT